MFQRHDIKRNACQLYGKQARRGYDWWWHSFTGVSASTGRERSFYIEYFLVNPEKGGELPVFGQLPENQKNGVAPSYLMVNAGVWGKNARQLHRFFGWKQVTLNYGAPFGVQAGDCFASETELRGSVSVSSADAERHPEWMSDAGSMSWSLYVDKQLAFNVGYGAGALFRRLQLFEMFWHAEGMKTAYTGTVTLDGETYDISPETCCGYADKNWGKDFTTPWLWLSSNDLTSELSGRRLLNSAFDIGGGRPKIGPISLKGKLLSAFQCEGKGYEFNFSKFWTFTRTRFSAHETADQIVWHVEQKTLFHRMVTDITCRKKDMLLINYESPSGEKRHTRLWNGGNGEGTVSLYRFGKLVERVRAAHVGCEYGEYDARRPYR